MERFLNECISDPLAVHNCGHNKDAGVICQGTINSCGVSVTLIVATIIKGIALKQTQYACIYIFSCLINNYSEVLILSGCSLMSVSQL